LEEQLPHVPNEYNLDSVNNFLTTSFFVTADDEMINYGTEKPGKKGRQLYNSSKIQFCETTKTATLTLFRCNMEASMKNNEFRLRKGLQSAVFYCFVTKKT
jgi:hypothetical protein